jgi:hypothetical protein
MQEKVSVCISGNSPCKYQSAEAKLRKFLEDEKKEIEKYRWCLGITLCRDPLEDRSINDICIEWISRYAAEFRETWEHKYGKVEDVDDGGDDNSESKGK